MRRPLGTQDSRNWALAVLADLSPVFQDEQETLVGVWKDNDACRVQFAAPVALGRTDIFTCPVRGAGVRGWREVFSVSSSKQICPS